MIVLRSALRLCVWLINDLYLKIPCVDDALLSALGAKEREVLQHRPLQKPQPCFCTTDRTEHPFFIWLMHDVHRLFDCRHEPCKKRAVHGFEAFQDTRFPVPAGGRKCR